MLYWDAYNELHTMRPAVLEGTATIPLDKIHWYADTELGLTGGEKRAFIWIMRRLDAAYIGFKSK